MHPAGFLQATHSLAGFEQGICVVFPPPPVLGVAGTPFKLYYGFEHHPWCSALALHFISMSFVGWYFLHLLKLDGRENKGSGLRFWQTPVLRPGFSTGAQGSSFSSAVSVMSGRTCPLPSWIATRTS